MVFTFSPTSKSSLSFTDSLLNAAKTPTAAVVIMYV